MSEKIAVRSEKRKKFERRSGRGRNRDSGSSGRLAPIQISATGARVLQIGHEGVPPCERTQFCGGALA